MVLPSQKAHDQLIELRFRVPCRGDDSIDSRVHGVHHHYLYSLDLPGSIQPPIRLFFIIAHPPLVKVIGSVKNLKCKEEVMAHHLTLY